VSEFRLQRVQNLVRDQISEMIMRGVVKDPRVDRTISITRVKVSRDLAYADIYVSTFRGRKKLQRAVEGLNNAAGFLHHKLRNRLRLRITPQVRFKVDNSIEEGFNMTQRLRELEAQHESDDRGGIH
jgi:ribosome-binding factor A